MLNVRLPVLATMTALLVALSLPTAGCDWPSASNVASALCPAPTLSDFSTDELVNELLGRGLDSLISSDDSD